MLRLMVTWLALVVLVGCSTSGNKRYIEPEDEFARQCIDDCQGERTRCLAYAQDIYRACEAEYQYQERVFQSCRQRGLGFCLKPERCPLPERQRCTAQYDACYRSCGGFIETGGEG